MKKTNLIKTVSIILITIMMVSMISTTIFAAEESPDVLQELENNSIENKDNKENVEYEVLEPAKPQEPAKPEEPAKPQEPAKNNTTVYNNEEKDNLPKTGLADELPLVCGIVALAVVAVVAFKKVKMYSEI